MASTSDTAALKEEFENKLYEILGKKRDDNNFFITPEKYQEIINRIKQTKFKQRKETSDYRCLARYDILVVDEKEKLIKPLNEQNSTILFYLMTTELFDILHEVHISIGHGGRNRMDQVLKNKYCNVTKETIMLYVSLCKLCQDRKPFLKKGISE